MCAIAVYLPTPPLTDIGWSRSEKLEKTVSIVWDNGDQAPLHLNLDSSETHRLQYKCRAMQTYTHQHPHTFWVTHSCTLLNIWRTHPIKCMHTPTCIPTPTPHVHRPVGVESWGPPTLLQWWIKQQPLGAVDVCVCVERFCWRAGF